MYFAVQADREWLISSESLILASPITRTTAVLYCARITPEGL